jgi:type IV secretion system protein VirD4
MTQQMPSSGRDDSDRLFVAVVLSLAVLAGVVWLGLELAGLFAGHLGVPIGLDAMLHGLVALSHHATDPRAGFASAIRADLPSAPLLYLAQGLVLVAAVGVACLVLHLLHGRSHARERADVAADVVRIGMARPAELRRAYPRASSGLQLGRVGRTVVTIPAETSVGVVMGSRMGKSSAAVGWVLDAPGAVLSTSTKVDVVYLTAVARERSTGQPTLVFDPEGLTAWPDLVRWSPIRGCENPGVAQERAAAMMAGVHMSGVTNSNFFRGKAAGLLRLVLHAAALEGADVAQLRRWVAAPAADPVVVRILRQREAADGWGEEWAGLLSGDSETMSNVAATAGLALDCLARPDVARLCSPGDAEAFDPVEWLGGGGTLHVVASGTAAASAAPLAAALVDAVMRAVRQLASSAEWEGRPKPSLRGVLDELPSVAPLPSLPAYLADAGGQGAQLVCIAQAMSQYNLAYGPEGRHAIEAALGALVIGGGVKDAEELSRYSRLVGEVEVRRVDQNRGPDGRGSYGSHRERRAVIEPHELGRLPKHQALLISQAARPAVVSLVPWWERRDAKAIEEARAEARRRAGRTWP